MIYTSVYINMIHTSVYTNIQVSYQLLYSLDLCTFIMHHNSFFVIPSAAITIIILVICINVQCCHKYNHPPYKGETQFWRLIFIMHLHSPITFPTFIWLKCTLFLILFPLTCESLLKEVKSKCTGENLNTEKTRSQFIHCLFWSQLQSLHGLAKNTSRDKCILVFFFFNAS